MTNIAKTSLIIDSKKAVKIMEKSLAKAGVLKSDKFDKILTPHETWTSGLELTAVPVLFKLGTTHDEMREYVSIIHKERKFRAASYGDVGVTFIYLEEFYKEHNEAV